MGTQAEYIYFFIFYFLFLYILSLFEWLQGSGSIYCISLLDFIALFNFQLQLAEECPKIMLYISSSIFI